MTYRVNSPHVISETVGGETIIVNLASGHYFSLQGTAVEVWQGLERGESAETIAFEDSTNGIRAAKAAQLFCVAVPNPLTADLDLSEADLRLPSLEAASLSELIGRAEAATAQ